MFERPGSGDAAILVSLDFGDTDYEESLEELRRLAESAGVSVRGVVRGKRSRPDAALFAGSGKADEIAEAVAASEASLVLFDHELSPRRNATLNAG